MAATGFLAGFLLGLLALAEAEAAALLWVARRLRRRQEGAAAAAAQPGDQELPGVVPSTEGCFLRPLPAPARRPGTQLFNEHDKCAGRKGPVDCTGRMGCRPLLLDLALLLDHVAPGSDGMDECSFIHGASADHSFFERGIWASILGLAPDYVSEGGVLIRYLSIL